MQTDRSVCCYCNYLNYMMKKSKKTSREDIIREACLEFVKNGIHGGSLNTILKNSGLSKGAFYHHFKSKEELVTAVINEYLANWINIFWLKPIKRGFRDEKKFLAFINRVNRNSIATNSLAENLIIVIISEFNSLDSLSKKTFMALIRKWLGSYTTMLRKSGFRNSRNIARLYISSLFGSILLSKGSNRKINYFKPLKLLNKINF